MSTSSAVVSIVEVHEENLAVEVHLNFPDLRIENDDLDYCWQYLNHSWEPNGNMDVLGLTFRAARDIRRGGEITFNYLTTESRMDIQGNDFISTNQLARFAETAPTAPLVPRLPLIQRTTGKLTNSFSTSMG